MRERTSTAELLLELQSIDYQLGELERSKEYLPDMIENLRKEIAAAEEEHENAKKRLEEDQLEKKRLEIELAETNDLLTKLKSQMTSIKTNREYDALSREIDHKKEQASVLEDQLLTVMTEIEELEEKIHATEESKEDVAKANTEQLDTIQGEIDSVGTKIKIKEDERNNILVRLSPSVVATYERIKRGKGSAVVPIRKRACSGCFKALPPQVVQEIRKGDQIICCDSCGRILIWEGED